ncbi:MAG: LysM peptidoglycan-binding domain-containing protein [Nitrospirota bacterium]|nr:LysM peptidoglycan-binding domain-containing protein [Nitrospirota bacterium]
MPDSLKLEKAELRELDAEFANEINQNKNVTVQFNPESIKVSFANQIQTPSGTGDQRGTPSRQFVGAGTTKLSLQLWFDVTAGGKKEKDVRKLTQQVAYFITPKPEADKFLPPAVRFLWGSFQFDGIMESLEESLEFFSNEGRPLRASMTVSLSQQKITEFVFRSAGQGGAPSTPGTKPLMQAPAGSTVQELADSQGKGGNWQAIASANNIENPRLLQPGQLIDMNAPLPKLSVSGELSVKVPQPSGVS